MEGEADIAVIVKCKTMCHPNSLFRRNLIIILVTVFQATPRRTHDNNNNDDVSFRHQHQEEIVRTLADLIGTDQQDEKRHNIYFFFFIGILSLSFGLYCIVIIVIVI